LTACVPTLASYFSTWAFCFHALAAYASAFACLSFKVSIADSAEGIILPKSTLSFFPFGHYPRSVGTFPTFNEALRWFSVLPFNASTRITARFWARR
jgi:hypothetical protein